MLNRSRPIAFHKVNQDAVIRLSKGRRIVIVAPHPDDETLGCGLLIARAARAGIPLAVVALTDGQASHPGSTRWPPHRLGALRRREMRQALARLGARAATCRFLGWPDGGLAAHARVRTLRRLLRLLDPAVVLAASPADHHVDHQSGWSLTQTALKGTGIPLIAYAVWARSGKPGPKTRDRARAAKRWAIAAHRSQTAGYITDAPQGFQLSAHVISVLLGHAEQFFAIGRKRRNSPAA